MESFNLTLCAPGVSLLMTIGISSADVDIPVPFSWICDSACCNTQMDTETATMLGLKSHKKLVGKSQIGNGHVKADYLCECKFYLHGKEKLMVVKVSDGQPCLLGLDIQMKFNLAINAPMLTYSFNTTAAVAPFKHLVMARLKEANSLGDGDLQAVELLVSPEVALQELIDAGKTNLVVDLGTTCTVTCVQKWGINLGYSL